jgi:hypothetical protein
MQATQRRNEGIEKPWLVIALAALLAVLALVFWYIQGHQEQVIRWLGKGQTAATEKPSAPRPAAPTR